ncbi:outer membrane protein [hydrocarbon metagenome]|uniref:Outer membrane protein n=1 Tax=hydrocarbon metagenome TaxID=938273 RepID=A0A0W8FSI8_9ZZZZ
MKDFIKTFLCLGFVLVLAGCGARSMVILIPDPDGNVGQLSVTNEGGQQILNEKNQSVKVIDQKTSPGKVTTLGDKEIQDTFSDALAAQPLQPITVILYFLEGSDELTDKSKTVLPKIFQAIQSRSSTDIVISGHTDTVGENEYNYKLSLERAQATYKILVANGAIPANITVTSHGEGNPLIKTADEVAEPRNRRVEITIR